MIIPDSLFKYSAFKDYSIKMIESGSIYLCPGDKLDDQFECLVDWSKYDNITVDRIYRLLKKQMKKKKILIPEIDVKNLYEDGVLNRDKARKIIKIKCKGTSNDKIEKFLDYIEELPALINTPEYHAYLEEIVNLNKKIGMFCMTTKKDSQVMWATYADNSKGYCIEYDIKSALANNKLLIGDILRVKYKYKRDADPLDLLLEYVFSRLKENKDLDDYEKERIKNMVISIISTKHQEWNFQKEWRIVGKPKDESIFLPIKAIYLGNKMDADVKANILQACKNEIPVYEQVNDYINLKIDFRLIEN